MIVDLGAPRSSRGSGTTHYLRKIGRLRAFQDQNQSRQFHWSQSGHSSCLWPSTVEIAMAALRYREDRKTWQVQIRLDGIRAESKSFNTKKEAQAWARE
jgi:hypothetical protein